MAKAPRSRKPAKRPQRHAKARPARKPVRGGARRPRKVAPRPAPAPAPARAPAAAAEQDDGRERALSAVAAGLDKKAEEPVVLDVRELSGVADYFVLMSADSDRQAAAIADAVDERLTGLGATRLGAEGRSGGGWVLLDFGSVVVHVMAPETRKFYDLEGLWADAPRLTPA
ncbi:MAG TPA: ribosome silencing factor [Anaeromyxobacteraceae bacterium]|nr:ribosome silencing factor [Anaeromyxobacteraceae bacterium]